MNVESKTQLCSASSTAILHLYQNIQHFLWLDKMDENYSLMVFLINFTMGMREPSNQFLDMNLNTLKIDA
jgi:hypothetical protein